MERLKLSAAVFCLSVALVGCVQSLRDRLPAVEPVSVTPAELAVLLAERLEDPGVKLLFLGPPRPAKVRYRYWTDRRYEGWAGLVAARGRSRSPVFRGEGGTALVVYVFDAEGQLALVTTNLDWTDVEPPLYALEEIDRTRTGSRLAPRPLGLDAETESLFRSFRSTPVDELPSYQ